MVIIDDLMAGGLLPYAAAFLVFFAVMFFALNRSVFKDSRGVATIIALAGSLLIVWGLVTKTDLLNTFVDMFDNFDASLRMIIFFVVVGGILILLVYGLKKGLRKMQVPWLLWGVAGLLILVWFLPDLMNEYYLPDILTNEVVQWLALIFGIVVGLYAIYKTRPLRLKKRTVGSEEYE